MFEIACWIAIGVIAGCLYGTWKTERDWSARAEILHKVARRMFFGEGDITDAEADELVRHVREEARKRG